ncbi:dihydroneopterin aldolase [Lolliginicoccus suaedae]|uniref:dihydroneopterin aldolase n=1 Tax=Lolliginicoccus suaedae TaxID=2605429 RepID=UPI0011F05FA8|nr:dihydroneopterin aldolase [Lolliginicoccus suaedae]
MSSSDLIHLRGLRARGHHGVFEHERRDGQEFIVDILLAVDHTTAGRTDDLADTLDYGALAHTAAGIISGEPCDLIETVATRIADAIFDDERIHRAEVTVHKPSAPIPHEFADVSVTVVRHREQAGQEQAGRGAR